ncbi:DUF4312 family protein [Bacillus sp. 1P06AnD]|uniref:DUF4312 family protein n=1 Tax=Bacillus sp. 1P06AnD TaxID=3132208 RepID=UPI00399F0DA1
MEKQTTVITVSAAGHTKEQAFSAALGQIQRNVLKEQDDMVIRIEPLDVRVVEAIEETYTERFLLLLFPRKRSKYKVTLEVKVELVLLEVNKVAFEARKQENFSNLKMKVNRVQR